MTAAHQLPDRQRVGREWRRGGESGREEWRPGRVGHTSSGLPSSARWIAVIGRQKLLVVLVVPGVDDRVRRTQVEQCEQARAVTHVEPEAVDEPAREAVVVRGRTRLPEGGGVRLPRASASCCRSPKLLDFGVIERVFRAAERVRPGVRNSDGVSSRNGVAFATHTVGSHAGAPPTPASGCHTPTAPVPNVHPIGIALLCPSASIAAAAISPTALPCPSPWSGMAVSERRTLRRTPPAVRVER